MFCKRSNTFQKNLLERNMKDMSELDRRGGDGMLDGNIERRSLFFFERGFSSCLYLGKFNFRSTKNLILDRVVQAINATSKCFITSRYPHRVMSDESASWCPCLLWRCLQIVSQKLCKYSELNLMGATCFYFC